MPNISKFVLGLNKKKDDSLKKLLKNTLNCYNKFHMYTSKNTRVTWFICFKIMAKLFQRMYIV